MWRRRVILRWQDSLWHAKSRGISCFRTALRENQNTTATRLEALFENYLVLCLGNNGKLQHIGLYLSTCVYNTVVALALIYLALSTLKPNYPIPPPQKHKKTRRGTARNRRRQSQGQSLIKSLFVVYFWRIPATMIESCKSLLHRPQIEVFLKIGFVGFVGPKHTNDTAMALIDGLLIKAPVATKKDIDTGSVCTLSWSHIANGIQ